MVYPIGPKEGHRRRGREKRRRATGACGARSHRDRHQQREGVIRNTGKSPSQPELLPMTPMILPRREELHS
jgi:hypothetical protein